MPRAKSKKRSTPKADRKRPKCRCGAIVPVRGEDCTDCFSMATAGRYPEPHHPLEIR